MNDSRAFLRCGPLWAGFCLFAAALALAVLVPGVAFAQNEDDWDTGEEQKSEPTAAAKAAIDALVKHYLAMYGQHLESSDWIVRAMAIIGLSEIDDPQIAAKLVEVLQEDKAPLVQAYAWEAVFARHKSLTDDQKLAWKAAGKLLASKGHLRGDLRVGLVRIMAEEGSTDENVKLFGHFFDRTNSMDPSDVPTLVAMRRCLARWKHAELIRKLIAAMSDINNAWRAEMLLQNLNSGVPAAHSLMQHDSQTIWERTQAAWVEWIGSVDLAAHRTFTTGYYGEKSVLIPPPQRIANPADPRWRKDLELRPLRLKDLDVVFVVDSTGSMGPVIRWIQRDVVKMMKAFGRISREPRIGVVFYRDHQDAYLVKTMPLTDKGEKLADAVAAIEAAGGGDVPEAVFEAIGTAVKKMKWTSSSRVIITVGDAPPHPDSVDRLKKAIVSATEKGFRFHFIKARTEFGSGAVAVFDDLADLGKGSSVWVTFVGDPGEGRTVVERTLIGMRREREVPASRGYLARLATDDYGEEADRQVVANVLRSVLNEDYHERVDPFVRVLLEYVDRPVPEKRAHFGPAPVPTTHTDGPRQHPPGPAPDPQR